MAWHSFCANAVASESSHQGFFQEKFDRKEKSHSCGSRASGSFDVSLLATWHVPRDLFELFDASELMNTLRSSRIRLCLPRLYAATDRVSNAGGCDRLQPSCMHSILRLSNKRHLLSYRLATANMLSVFGRNGVSRALPPIASSGESTYLSVTDSRAGP
jgi:hypothetical protein